jgi:hypothetical protein
MASAAILPLILRGDGMQSINLQVLNLAMAFGLVTMKSDAEFWGVMNLPDHEANRELLGWWGGSVPEWALDVMAAAIGTNNPKSVALMADDAIGRGIPPFEAIPRACNMYGAN